MSTRKVSSGGPDIPTKSVDSGNVIGKNDSVQASGADGFSDPTSSKANRKEAMEPQRDAAERKATSSNAVGHSTTFGHSSRAGQEAPAKNVIGHGQRETVARNTI